MLVKLSVAGFIGAFLGGCSKTSGVKVLLLNPLQENYYRKQYWKLYCLGSFQICETTSLSLDSYSGEF